MTDTFIIPPGSLVSILGAVNAMIATLGEAPVDSLTAPTSDVSLALNTLDIQDQALQARGWSWNRLVGFQLNPNEDGTISVPNSLIELSRAYISQGTFPSYPGNTLYPLGMFNYSVRNGYVWDKYNNTNVIGIPIYADMIIRSDWEDIPLAFRIWLIYSACRRFHAQLQERQILLEVNADDLKNAMMVAMQREDESERYNTISGNVGVVTKLYGYGGLRRNRGGLSS